jgi:hypothetical protein
MTFMFSNMALRQSGIAYNGNLLALFSPLTSRIESQDNADLFLL